LPHPSVILKNLGASARKSLGQNFLVETGLTSIALDNFFTEKEWAEKGFLEIGPGLGAVTRLLLRKSRSVHACEYDKMFAPFLKQEFPEIRDQIFQADFLDISPEFWLERKISHVVGNLPFYITSPIIIKIIRDMPFVEKAFLGLQWDYASKLQEDKLSSISTFLKTMGDVAMVKKIPRGHFFPVPGVDAAWIGWVRNPGIPPDKVNHYEIFLRGVFWGKRKTLGNSLINNPHYPEHPFSAGWPEIVKKEKGISPDFFQKRPEDLTLEEMILLFQKLEDFPGNSGCI